MPKRKKRTQSTESDSSLSSDHSRHRRHTKSGKSSKSNRRHRSRHRSRSGARRLRHHGRDETRRPRRSRSVRSYTPVMPQASTGVAHTAHMAQTAASPGVTPVATDLTGESRLREVLNLLKENGLTLKLSKCHFFYDKIDYLGYEVSSSSIRPGTPKTEAVEKFPTPRNIHEVRRYSNHKKG
ncbi:unnamed protein product, partial [Brenthis ino]